MPVNATVRGIAEKLAAALILAGIMALFSMHTRLTRVETRLDYFHGDAGKER
jgi:hypothetical protein